MAFQIDPELYTLDHTKAFAIEHFNHVSEDLKNIVQMLQKVRRVMFDEGHTASQLQLTDLEVLFIEAGYAPDGVEALSTELSKIFGELAFITFVDIELLEKRFLMRHYQNEFYSQQ